MNFKYYKNCAVPLCKSTTIKTPKKLFIYVPNNESIRTQWLKLARRDPKSISMDSRIYFCEDHFDMPNDMENYMQYHLMGSVYQVRMKPDCIPSRFECQPFIKKHRNKANKECRKELNAMVTIESCVPKDVPSASLDLQGIKENPQTTLKSADKSIQVHIKPKFRSKAIQTGTNVVSQGISTMPIICRTVATSPINYEFSDNMVCSFKKSDNQMCLEPNCSPATFSCKPETLELEVEMEMAETPSASSMSYIDKTELKIKVSAAQTGILCNFFEENPEVIRGYKRTPKCIDEVQNKWKKITPYLNAVGPPRDHKAWAKYLLGMKAKLKRKRIKWRQSCDGKGPIMCNVDDFNEIRLRMLQVLRKDVSNSQESQDSHTSDLETEDDNNDDDDLNEGENYEMETLPEEIPDVKPKLGNLGQNHSVTNDTPPPDLQPRQSIFDDEFDHFGKNVAEQLRGLPLFDALEAQEMILTVLKKQRLKVLNETFGSSIPIEQKLI